MFVKATDNYPAKRLFPVMPHYIGVGFAVLGVPYGIIKIGNWVAIVVAVVTIGLVSASFVGAAALMHFCNSVGFAACSALWFVVLTVAGYTLADVGRLPLATAEPTRVVFFTILLLGTHERSVGPVKNLPGFVSWMRQQSQHHDRGKDEFSAFLRRWRHLSNLQHYIRVQIKTVDDSKTC
jgi:hypothetical protein